MSYEQIARQQRIKEQVSKQAQTVYEDYKKIKGFKDVGYLLEDYVIRGGEVTKDLARNDTVHVTEIVVSLNDNMLSREGHSFSVDVPNTAYYLDFNKDGDWRWGLSHEGEANEDYIAVASVTTNSSGLVQSITDLRGQVGGMRLKSEYGLEQYAKNQYVDDKIDDVNAQLADTTNEVNKLNEDVKPYWTPPLQPPARSDLAGWFADGFNWTADQYITNLWEPLRASDTNYITRDSQGKDASGTYDIYRYYFTPRNYVKTLIIGTCMHGGEVTPMLAMYRFLYYLTNEWYRYPQLTDIRQNVRIILTPIQNPWGVSQKPRKRQNANGVDINRNWDYMWSDYPVGNPFDHDYKGTAPFSEVETQYIRNTLDQFRDAVAYIDMHNLGEPNGDYVYYNAINADNQFVYTDLSRYLTKDITSPDIVVNTNNYPSGYNYALKVRGIVSGNPEWADKRFGGSMYNEVEMTKSLEWFANIVIQHARVDIFKTEESFVVETHYERSSTNLNLAVGSYAEIQQFRHRIDIPCDGVVVFEGSITLLGSDDTAIHFICPRIGQVGGDFDPVIRPARHETYGEGNKRLTIPFNASIPVKRSGFGYEQVSIGLSGYTSAGTTTIYRYRGRATFIPTKHLSKFKIYRATGRESEGLNAMQIEYPTL